MLIAKSQFQFPSPPLSIARRIFLYYKSIGDGEGPGVRKY